VLDATINQAFLLLPFIFYRCVAFSPTGRILAVNSIPIYSTLIFEKRCTIASVPLLGETTMSRILFWARRSLETKLCWTILPLILITCPGAWARQRKVSFFGAVTDSPGSVVPHFNVVVISVERSVSRKTVTSQ
jgi:hypothetical protein